MRTHCKYGHDLTLPDAVYHGRNGSGSRFVQCRACKRMQRAERIKHGSKYCKKLTTAGELAATESARTEAYLSAMDAADLLPPWERQAAKDRLTAAYLAIQMRMEGAKET